MNWTLFLALLAALESGGIKDPDNAIGDGGLAIGRYQIRQEFVDECNRILGYELFTLDEAKKPGRARVMVMVWHNYWSLKKDVRGDLVAMARMHNGGPNGHTKQSTEEYGRRAAKILAALKQERGEI